MIWSWLLFQRSTRQLIDMREVKMSEDTEFKLEGIGVFKVVSCTWTKAGIYVCDAVQLTEV